MLDLTYQENLTAEQIKVVEISKTYVTQFNHGTDGHNHFTLIARLAEMLENFLPSQFAGWHTALTAQQNQEIAFCELYVLRFEIPATSEELHSIVTLLVSFIVEKI